MVIHIQDNKVTIIFSWIDEQPFIDIKDDYNSIDKNLSGIYFIYNSDKELIYIGSSKNIRSRINMHKNGFG